MRIETAVTQARGVSDQILTDRIRLLDSGITMPALVQRTASDAIDSIQRGLVAHTDFVLKTSLASVIIKPGMAFEVQASLDAGLVGVQFRVETCEAQAWAVLRRSHIVKLTVEPHPFSETVTYITPTVVPNTYFGGVSLDWSNTTLTTATVAMEAVGSDDDADSLIAPRYRMHVPHGQPKPTVADKVLWNHAVFDVTSDPVSTDLTTVVELQQSQRSINDYASA